MKRLIVLAMLGFAAISVTPARAQVSLNINIGAQPDWGPRGYDHVDYYYLPEVESYYYVPSRKFIYLSGGNWIYASRLPSRYRHYDLHRGRKVVINENRPYLRHRSYKQRYVSNYDHSRPRYVSHRTSYYKSDSKGYRKNEKHYRKQEKNWNKGNDSRNSHDRGGRGNGHGHGNNGRH
jgi:hypothetical protein